MKIIKKVVYIIFTILLALSVSQGTFAARAANQIEVYRIGETSLTVKWTPYVSGTGTVAKYSVGYKVSGDVTYTYIDVDGSSSSPDYYASSNEYSKKITGLTSGTIYDVKIDIYLQGNPTPVTFYNSIKAMTEIVIDRTITTIANPYGNDNVGHLDFAFSAPNEMSGGITASVDKSNITGYNMVISASEGQIYSSGQPYKVLYNSGTGNYDIYKVTTADNPLTYDSGSGPQQFSFAPQTISGKDALGFSLYKSNQPTTDNYNMATIYYVYVQPIFKSGSPYQNVIVDATARYESVENIATLLPLTVEQVSDDLIKLEFSSTGTGSMSYDIYRGRLANSLTRIHTEYDDGTRNTIQYYNKIDNPQSGDVYYFQVSVAGQTYGVSSKVIPTTISLTPNIAPVINNIQIERVIGDTVNKSSDVIISWDKPENEEINKANLSYRVYINTDQASQVNNNDIIRDVFGNVVTDSNGKIVLNVKKDINNNDILYNGLPVVYERVTEIDPNNLSGSGVEYTGNDPVGYFLATGKNYYKIIRDGHEVIRTIYRIKGANFLSNSDVPVVGGAPHTIYLGNYGDELATDYKTKLELNTSYFLKMDSFNSSISERADYSIPVGFTTPTDVVSTIPTPQNFGVELITTNKIGLLWDPLDSVKYNDTKVTYEIYMSDTDNYADSAFNRLKTLTLVPNTDGKKHIVIDSTYSLIDSLGNDLPNMPANVNPNTVYLFRIRAIWSTIDQAGNNVLVYSGLSPIVPVTTLRTTISDPDMTAPPAPVDFAATSVASKTANFAWTKVDDFSTYRIIRTSTVIDPFAPLPAPPDDGVVSGFTLTGNTYTYSDSTLVANTLYYFSIRSEVVVNGSTLYSPWITIPVTTILVETPTELALVSRGTDGHSVTISWKGRGNLNFESAKKDDSMQNYQISETVIGDPTVPGLKSFQLTLSGLNSNDMYMIKVRAKDPATGMYSKYTDAIEVRTQFNQTDYDNDAVNKEKLDLITSKSQEWLKNPIARVGYEANKLEYWIKYNRSNDLLQNIAGKSYTIQLNDNNLSQYKDVFIPSDFIDALNNAKTNVEIKTDEGSLYLRPELLNSDKMSAQFNYIGVKSIAAKVMVSDLSSTDAAAVIPSGSYPATPVSDISIKIDGFNMTGADLDKAISDKINSVADAEKALVGVRTKDQVAEQLDARIRAEIKNLLSSSLALELSYDLGDSKVLVDYSYKLDSTGKSSNYTAYIRNNDTAKEVQGQVVDTGKIRFEMPMLGKLVILGKSAPNDVTGITSSDDIKYLISNYDFSKETANGKFRPDDAATREDAVNFIINVLAPSGSGYDNLSSVEKAKKIGLLDGFPVWDLKASITREELAYLISKAYQVKTAVDPKDFVPSKNITFKDADSINQKYQNSVLEMTDNNIMPKVSQYFYPDRQVTRAETATALVKMINWLEGTK